MGWFLEVDHGVELENELIFAKKHDGKMGFQAPGEAAGILEIFTECL